MDIFSTLLNYSGLPNEQGDMTVPSRSLKPLLAGNSKGWGEDAVYSEQEETRVLRTSKWVYFKRFRGAPNHPISDALYDVQKDPSEKVNLADDPSFADVLADLDQRLTTFFETHARAGADLWHGGVPLQHSERSEFWRDAWGEDWAPVYRIGAD